MISVRLKRASTVGLTSRSSSAEFYAATRIHEIDAWHQPTLSCQKQCWSSTRHGKKSKAALWVSVCVRARPRAHMRVCKELVDQASIWKLNVHPLSASRPWSKHTTRACPYSAPTYTDVANLCSWWQILSASITQALAWRRKLII